MRLFVGALALVLAAPAIGQDMPRPMNLADVDAAELKAFLGPYTIKDQSGRKTCRVVLKREETIGGFQIDIDKGCDRTFPLMGEITAWRLLEGWQIQLVDGLRKGRIRFYTPDNSYISDKEIDGIFSIAPTTGKKVR